MHDQQFAVCHISARQTTSADVAVIGQAASLTPGIIHEFSRGTWLQELDHLSDGQQCCCDPLAFQYLHLVSTIEQSEVC